MRRGWPPLRGLLLMGVVAVVTASFAVVGIIRVTGADAEVGAVVDRPVLTTPATAGRDVDGSSIRLPSPSGRPAMVTFLFTECPDTCPMVASHIAAALDRAGAAAEGIDVVAISVDPPGDSPAAVRDFLARHDLQGRMRYMIGTRAELQPVWDAWGVLPQVDGHAGGDHAGHVHSAPIIFIDATGRQVARYAPGEPYGAADLEREIRTLAG